RLAPGAMSGLVRSPFGFHIIRRPPLEEVRDSFRTELETALAVHFDSVYIDSVASRSDMRVRGGAAALVRQAIQDVAPAADDDRQLAGYRGGAFRVRDLARWLYALDPRDLNVAMASDAQLTEFVRQLAQRELLLREVDSAGVALSPEDWRGLKTQHDSVLAILENQLALSPRTLKDSAATESARSDIAMRHVNDYLDRALVQETAQFFPVPPFLALALRSGQGWSVSAAGLAQALERAQGIRAQVDSAGRRAGPGREATRRQVLRQMVDEELIVQQAERDTTIKVTDQEVQDQVEQTVQNVRKQFSSTSDFLAQLRAAQFVTEEEWRRWLADQQRRTSL